ncbi:MULTISPECIES: hypothetical protein [unclassified Mesorhizobium]|uniref:hypothetical protein n=1 Tax=unclassified Mesorhizobium TaxID=325217 RepID=UPI000FCBA5CD|nr:MULTISPECIES: hypothetical protein [unclassified Mesorhizobium]RUW77260.1 hypothetical protein EOA31_04920 [Mesorhizobium sp. M4B.F.Ca.ET.049.02.1.2]TGV23193.1 hypothetical protein EN786_25200 [Mesorhizobium sp. M4B.F.Ca.ET.143.01.1.1]
MSQATYDKLKKYIDGFASGLPEHVQIDVGGYQQGDIERHIGDYRLYRPNSAVAGEIEMFGARFTWYEDLLRAEIEIMEINGQISRFVVFRPKEEHRIFLKRESEGWGSIFILRGKRDGAMLGVSLAVDNIEAGDPFTVHPILFPVAFEKLPTVKKPLEKYASLKYTDGRYDIAKNLVHEALLANQNALAVWRHWEKSMEPGYSNGRG